MPFHKSPRIDHVELERVAQGWGKVVARRVHEQVGPDLELDADNIETVANEAARVVSCSAIADLLHRKAALLGSQQPCPTCQRLCQVDLQPRTIDFRGGPVRYAEPVCHCPAYRRDFSPQRPSLSLTNQDLSPSMVRKVVRSAAREPSFREPAEALGELADRNLSSRRLDRIAHQVGQ